MNEVLNPETGNTLLGLAGVIGLVVLFVVVFTVLFILTTNKKKKQK